MTSETKIRAPANKYVIFFTSLTTKKACHRGKCRGQLLLSLALCENPKLKTYLGRPTKAPIAEETGLA